MYIKNNFNCNELTELELTSNPDSLIESLWLEISNSNKKYVVAGIYRHPNSNISHFCKELENSLELITKSKTPCIIAGDINIDLVKYASHHLTTDYVNTLLINNFMPMIIMPSRITSKSATIIDDIYYYEGYNCKKDVQLMSGNLRSDLTDHLPNYFIMVNNHVKPNADRPYVRLFSEKIFLILNPSLIT